MSSGIDAAQWQAFASPRRIAMVGASGRPGPLNFAMRLRRNNEQLGYPGKTYYINPRHDTIFDEPCYPDLAALPEPVDVCLIASPSAQVIDTVRAGIADGIRAFIVHSGDFGDGGARGRARQAELEEVCADGRAALIGPNCLGLYHSRGPVALYGGDIPAGLARGGLAMIAGSGSVSVSMLHLARRLGLHSLVSTGNEAVTTAEDILEHLVADPDVRVIAMFVESLRRPEKFRELAMRAAAAGKPIVALKAGVSGRGAAAAMSHTGAMVGSGAAYRALFEQVNVIGVDDFDELAQTVALLSGLAGNVPDVPGVGIAGISGGKLSVVIDLADRLDVPIADLSPRTVRRLGDTLQLEDGLAAGNPVDVGTGFRNRRPVTDTLADCVRILSDDPGVGLVLVQQTITGLAEASSPEAAWIDAMTRIAPELATPVAMLTDVHPLAAVAPADAHGGRVSAASATARSSQPVPVLAGLRPALLAVKRAVDWRHRAEHPWSSPARADPPCGVDALRRLLRGRHGLLDPGSTNELLRAYGIPTAESRLLTTDGEPIGGTSLRELSLSYPVVAKIVSPDIAHKSDVGGVVLGIADADRLREAIRKILSEVSRNRPDAEIVGIQVAEQLPAGQELYLGSRAEPGLGVTTAIGWGGVNVEMLGRPRMLAAPYGLDQARDALTRMPGAALLEGYRGAPATDLDGLARTLTQLGRLAVDFADRVVEIDLNPLIPTPSQRGGIVADARVILN